MGVSFILTRLARIRQDLFVTYNDTVKHFLSFKSRNAVYIFLAFIVSKVMF